MYNNSDFPLIEYDGRVVINNTIRISINDYVKKHIGYFFDYTVQDYERPETLSFDFFGTSKLGWVIMLMNNIHDPFHDWVMEQRIFRKYMVAKYLGDTIDPDEWHHFENEAGVTIPEPESDGLKAKYGISNLDFELAKIHSYVKDGERIVKPSSSIDQQLYAKTFLDHEEEENNKRRQIKIPRLEYIGQIEKELRVLLAQ